MKKLMILISLIIAIGAISAQKFDPDYFVSRTIIGCFTKAAVPNVDGVIEYTIEDGVVHTGLESFDQLAQQYRIVGLDPFYTGVKDKEWNENGIYLQNTYRIRLESDDFIDDATAALAKDPNLVYAELEAILRSKFVPNDPMVTQQYTHARIRSYDAWDYIQGSYDVKVAIADSGVKWNHPDLRANIWINPLEAPGMTINWDAGTISGGNGVNEDGGSYGKIDDLIGWDFYNVDNNPYQNYVANDHGTHVAGCAAAVGNNSIGVTGTSPMVSIISCKGAPNTSPSTSISNGYDMLRYAAELGADIINASWGGPGAGTTATAAVNYATSQGALVVTAAGNENTEHNASYQDFPADCVNALCVASTGQNDVKSSFSDFGAPIDICAPGEGILSTIIANNGYDSYDGTSMASPVVAGVAALVKAMHPTLSPGALKDRLQSTADYIYDTNPDYVGKLGSGRVNAFSATMFDKIPYITIDEQMVEEFAGDGDTVPNPGETIRLKLSLNNYLSPTGLAWLTAENLQATLTCNYPGVTIIDANASYGTLYPGSTMWNNSQPFKFQTVASLPSEPIPFELVLTANAGASYPYNKTLPFFVSLSLVQQGWPYDVGGASTTSPILVNLDAEPNLEIVFADQAGYIHAMKKDGVTELPGFPVIAGATLVGSMSMSDVNADGLMEFAASLQNGGIMLFNQLGTALWTAPAGGTLRSGPIIASLGNGNSRQIITATQTGSLIVLNNDGTFFPNFPVSVGGAILGPPAIADLDDDGDMDIIVATLNGNLSVFDSSTGQLLPGFPLAMPGGSQNPITIANLDADEDPDILVTTSTAGYILAYHHDGSVLFQKNVGGQIKTGAVVADVNNDGTKEIIVIGATGIVHVLTPAGIDLPNTPINVNQAVECTPTVARFDGDNYAGIIFGDTNGKIHSVRVNGSESSNFPINITGNIKVSAALADVDLDSDFDIVIPNDAGFYILDIKRPVQSIEWPCFLGSYTRSGNIYQNTPTDDHVVPVVQTALKSNFPNPFNPSTIISFSLAAPDKVNIQIFNQKGQLVRTLVNANLPSGDHQIAWNGLDNSNSPVSSGVYFYRMQSGKFSSTRKMVMLK